MSKQLSLPKALTIMFFIVFLLVAGSSAAGDLTRTTMKVENLYCGSCLTHIDATLGKMDGVDGMQGNLARGIVAVDHQPSLAGEKIAAAITQLGYPAKIVSKTQITGQNAFSSQPRAAASCCGAGDQRYACGGSGAQRYGCGAGAGAWKKLFRSQSPK